MSLGKQFWAMHHECGAPYLGAWMVEGPYGPPISHTFTTTFQNYIEYISSNNALGSESNIFAHNTQHIVSNIFTHNTQHIVSIYSHTILNTIRRHIHTHIVVQYVYICSINVYVYLSTIRLHIYTQFTHILQNIVQDNIALTL